MTKKLFCYLGSYLIKSSHLWVPQSITALISDERKDLYLICSYTHIIVLFLYLTIAQKMTRYFPTITFSSHLLQSSQCLKQMQLPIANSVGAAGGYVFLQSSLVEEEDCYNFCCGLCSPDPWLRYLWTKTNKQTKPQVSLPKENSFGLRQQNQQRNLTCRNDKKGKEDISGERNNYLVS